MPSCALQLFTALLRPIAIVLLIAFIIAAEGRTSAWFITTPTEPYSVEDFEVPNLIGEVQDEEQAGVEPASYQVPAYHADAYEQKSLVKFITGVIAVYHPGISNAGETARHIVQLSQDAKI